MCKKSPMMTMVMMVVWFLTAFAAILAGLRGLGWDLAQQAFVQNNLLWLVKPAQLVFGAAGVISLVMLLMACMCGCRECKGGGSCSQCGSSSCGGH